MRLHTHIYVPRIMWLIIATASLLATSCRKFVTVDPPKNSLIDANTFSKEQTATSALTEIYYHVSDLFATPNAVSYTKASALSADEMTLSGTNPTLQMLYTHSLDVNQESLDQFWSQAYTAIYKANAVLEGVSKYGSSIAEENRNQLVGEAKFLRAYFHFLLMNFYGDIPLVLTSDYLENKQVIRSPVNEVYAQLLTDLEQAHTLVRSDYLNGNNTPSENRVRANKDVVAAFLARVYLYNENWVKAEEMATSLIDNSSVFSLNPDLKSTFSTNSREAIMQLDQFFQWSLHPYGYVSEYELEAPPLADMFHHFGYLSDDLMEKFEPGDTRKDSWVRLFVDGNSQYPHTSKYYNNWGGTHEIQFLTIFRLAETYLIRAEARIQQNNLAGGIDDLNFVRARARSAASGTVPDPLPPLPATLSKTGAMLALEKERETELFLEGHRWFDLKRWKGISNPSISRADELMPAITGARGSNWNSAKKLFPLPQNELSLNVNLIQNPGY